MPQATRVLAIRHGETEWNADGRIQGHTDIGLSARGRWQAQRLGTALASEPLAAVFSSDLARAHDTATALARPHGLPVSTLRALRERGFGAFEGLSFAQVEAQHPDAADQWRRRVPDFAPPNGENLLQLKERIIQAIQGLCADFVGHQIAIVSHGGVLDTLYRHATGLDLQAPRTWALGNAGINRLLWVPDDNRGPGQLTLVGWGDDFHLQAHSALDERTS